MKEADIRPQALFNRYLELSRQDIEHFFADHSQFVPVACPACDSQRADAGLEKFGFQYVTCQQCGTLYLSPRPTPAMINAYYRESASVKFWETHFFKETAEARREKMFKPRAHLAAEWADQMGIEPTSTFVDVGSGYGIFLEEVARIGRFGTVMGIEPAPNLAAVCRSKGFSIVEKPVEDVQREDVQAAFATAFEVIEHVYNPLVFLQSVRRTLQPGGIVLLTTLTVSGFDIQVLWEHSKSVSPPHHINFMSVEGMERLVERAGFEVIELSTPGKLDVDITRNIVNENPDIVLPRFVRQLLFACPEETREAFQHFLQAHRLSSHIRVVARTL
jgi:2-polyprenyl-3-methyl-5-hydroxy-6-metoxy-1,4-benzoquinol methylase